MRRQRLWKTARARLGWLLLFIVVLHCAVHVILEVGQAEAYDPEYQRRLSLLQERLAEDPDRPLLLVVGSSRIATAFRPETLPELWTADGELPLAFNFSHTGAGPLLNLMEVDRLLRRGIRPRWLVVEVLPAMLKGAGGSNTMENAESRDLALLSQHMPAWKVLGHYACERLVPSTRHYGALLRPSLPDWLAPESSEFPLDPLGGSCFFDDHNRDSIRQRTEAVRGQYEPALQQFTINPVADGALRSLLERCRAEDIPVVLLLTPEASEFRGWYHPVTADHVDRYCADLSREFNVPFIDARAWLDDSAFIDAHHTHPEGAAHFTCRLGSDVLQPLVDGKLR